MYEFILNDMEEALPYHTNTPATILQPDQGAAYAFNARIFLQMNDFDKAEEYADKALDENDLLFDWIAYYEAHKDQIEDAESYISTSSPIRFDYVENFVFRHGSNSSASTEYSITPERAELFEEGDARFLSRWKFRTVGSDTYFFGTLQGYFNYGGITTTEVYLIKAECMARRGGVNGAMEVLNKVRRSRILPSFYEDKQASDEAEAMNYIILTKRNELIMTLIPFSDIRRWNHEGTYTTTLTKTLNGETYSLHPASHLWTMPFPQGAVDFPGNGSIIQNAER